jgi:hypothetical protein
MTTGSLFEGMQEASEHTLLSHKPFYYLVILNAESECLATSHFTSLFSMVHNSCTLVFFPIWKWCYLYLKNEQRGAIDIPYFSMIIGPCILGFLGVNTMGSREGTIVILFTSILTPINMPQLSYSETWLPFWKEGGQRKLWQNCMTKYLIFGPGLPTHTND